MSNFSSVLILELKGLLSRDPNMEEREFMHRLSEAFGYPSIKCQEFRDDFRHANVNSKSIETGVVDNMYIWHWFCAHVCGGDPEKYQEMVG